MSKILAPKLPLTLGSDTQYEMINNYTKLALQNLKMLVLTIPGERVMDTNFGVGLSTFLFELNNMSTRNSISAKIQEQVSEYLPYIEILNIMYHSSLEDPTVSEHFLSIKIEFNIIPVGINTSLILSLDGDEIIDSSEIVTYS